jgi:CBS domain-containing protein
MNVRDCYTEDVRSCTADTDLARAASIMWECDCGTVPVVDNANKVVGMITDRDICMAVATKNTTASQIRVADVMSKKLFTCKPQDDIKTALRTMAQNRVRRLPVTDANGILQGVLSMNDIVCATAETNRGLGEEVLETYRAICEHSVKKEYAGAPKRR